jgi:hypothetical protein
MGQEVLVMVGRSDVEVQVASMLPENGVFGNFAITTTLNAR